MAMGTAPPTIADVPAMPADLSMRCIEPPREPAQPLMRQCISHSMRLQVATLGQIGAVGAMAGVDEIRYPQSGAAANRGGFLTDHQVDRCLHLILAIAPLDLLFDAADPQHVAEELRVELGRVTKILGGQIR